MQRSRVDLPLPEAPIRQTTSCSADGQVDPAQDLERSETLVEALDPDDVGGHRAPARKRRRSRATR